MEVQKEGTSENEQSNIRKKERKIEKLCSKF